MTRTGYTVKTRDDLEAEHYTAENASTDGAPLSERRASFPRMAAAAALALSLNAEALGVTR